MSWDGFPARKWSGLPPEFWVGGLAFAALHNGTQMAVEAFELSDATRWVLALAPLVPLILVVRGVIRGIRHQDELHRRIELEATGYATAVVIVLSFMLENLEILSMIAPVRSGWAAVALIVSRVIAVAMLKRRYA